MKFRVTGSPYRALLRDKEERTKFSFPSPSHSSSPGFPSGISSSDKYIYTFVLFSGCVFFLTPFLYPSLFCLVNETMDVFEDTEDMMTSYLVFHLIGISSTCTNPILYGFLNDNFKKVWIVSIFTELGNPHIPQCMLGPKKVIFPFTF